MTKYKKTKRAYRKSNERRIWIAGVRRDPPDVQRLSRALVARAREMAQAQAEADAAAHIAQAEADPDLTETTE